ncbi:MerR family transcriptional regulator [Blautia sp. OF11-22]|nr:MerR family transcriptional regulator [Blautia sp. OF11-22]
MTGQKEKRGATMRIQEVIKKTGLSRRTVYYYIDQKMISPVVDEHNGYHDFSEADIQKLFIIRKLREAGLSLADIRAILHKPRTTPFYLHKQLNALQSQMLTIQQTISEMDRLSGQLLCASRLNSLRGCLQIPIFARKILPGIRWNPGMPGCWHSICGWHIWIRRLRNISSFCGRKSHSIRLSTQVRI